MAQPFHLSPLAVDVPSAARKPGGLPAILSRSETPPHPAPRLRRSPPSPAGGRGKDARSRLKRKLPRHQLIKGIAAGLGKRAFLEPRFFRRFDASAAIGARDGFRNPRLEAGLSDRTSSTSVRWALIDSAQLRERPFG